MTIALPLAAAAVGALVYAVSANAKAAEIGRALLWSGLIGFFVTFPGR